MVADVVMYLCLKTYHSNDLVIRQVNCRVGKSTTVYLHLTSRFACRIHRDLGSETDMSFALVSRPITASRQQQIHNNFPIHLHYPTIHKTYTPTPSRNTTLNSTQPIYLATPACCCCCCCC